MNNLIQKLSHFHLPYKISVTQAIIILAIKYFQILALIQPVEINTSESSLLFAQGFLKTTLIIPYAHNFTLITFALFILVFKNFILILCSIVENSKAQIASKLAIIFIYYDSIIVEQILALPELYLYMGLISYSNKKMAFESFKFEYVAPLSIFMILLVSTIATIRCYFFRASNIIENTKLLPKFTYLTICRFSLQLLIIIVCLDQRLIYLKFSIGILIFIISLFELHFETIFEPYINQSLILIISSILTAVLIEFICLISFGQIEFKAILLLIVLFLPLNIVFFKQLIIRKQLNILLNLHDYPLILVIEELYEFIHKKSDENMSQQDVLILYQIQNEHCKTCITCNKDSNVIKLIQCLIMNKFKQDEKSKEKESLMILYINFLCDKMMQPLIAYVELKKFEFKAKRFSLYYRFIRQDYNAKFKEKIEDKQAHMNLKSQSQIQQIEIKEIIYCFHLEEIYLKLYIKLLDQKVKVLNLQIKGVEQINELKLVIMKYGKELHNTIQKYKQDFKIIPNQEIDSKNIIILKLITVLYSVILNDFDTAKIIEDQILQICTSENSLPLDSICNASFVEDKVCLLSISMVKNRGKILNTNKKQLAKHFGYGHDDSHMINHINDLVPPFLVEVHDAILEQYLQTAQSLLFKQFNMITTQQQGGLLQIKQLKLDNNFNFEDDYVITGCVAKVKEGSEFIIFDQAGKILSSTEAIYQLMIQGIDQEDEMPIQTLSQCYIFFFFPEIIKIFQNHKITNKSYHNMEIEDVATLVTRFNIIDFINQYQRALSLVLPHKRYQTENRGSQYFQKSKTSGLMTDSMSSISPIERVIKPKNDLQIFTITYQRQVEEAMSKLNEVGEAAYQVKFQLSFKRIGFEHINKAYFIMEILDFRSKEQLLSKRRRISAIVPHHNFHPMQSSRFKQESFREDSKRMDQSSEQFIQSFALINQQHDLLMHENSSQKRYKSSQSEDIKSSQKSDSSQDSSQLNQNKECHTFIDSNNLIIPLRIISLLTVIICILLISFLILNLVIIEQNTSQIVQSNININAPLTFNRQFFQLFSLSWIQLLNQLGILSNSEFLLNQTHHKLQNISESTFSILKNLYSTFIEFEQADLLDNLSFRHFDEDLQNVSYTYFILNLEDAMKEVLVTSQNQDMTSKDLTINYINQMMNVRINLYNNFQMCKDLIVSYDDLYQQTIEVQTQKIEYLTIVMGLIVLIKLLPQYIYQLKCQQLQRQLIFMIGRVKEKETRLQIQKFTSIKEILENKENNFNWRQINYTLFGHHKGSESVSQRGSQQTTRMINRQPIVLNTRIQNTQIRKKSIILILTITYLTIVVFLSGGLVLYEIEVTQMQPFSQMTTQFITFSTNFDALIGSGIVVKTIYTVFKKLVSTQVATQQQVSKYMDPNMALFRLFLESEANFDANLTSIFEQIVVSKQINDADKGILENLYKYDICDYFQSDIPYCKFNQVNQDFITQYSQPNAEDDIKIFYQNGIKGVTSQINQIIKQQFYNEIEYQKLYEISPTEQVFLDSQQFNNGFLQQFLFTTKTIDVFLDIIQYSNEQYSEVNLINIQIYYCLTGSVMLIIYLIVYCKWIQIIHHEMRYIKLGLSLLPQKAMNDPFVLNTIKQLR